MSAFCPWTPPPPHFGKQKSASQLNAPLLIRCTTILDMKTLLHIKLKIESQFPNIMEIFNLNEQQYLVVNGKKLLQPKMPLQKKTRKKINIFPFTSLKRRFYDIHWSWNKIGNYCNNRDTFRFRLTLYCIHCTFYHGGLRCKYRGHNLNEFVYFIMYFFHCCFNVNDRHFSSQIHC